MSINIAIIGQVTDENKNKIEIPIYQSDIEELILAKAKEEGISGYEGTLFRHWDETVLKVVIDE
jgi:hypothetical protein